MKLKWYKQKYCISGNTVLFLLDIDLLYSDLTNLVL